MEKLKTIIMVILIAGDIALGVACWVQEKKAAEAVWFDSYPMANQHITWTGAGYQQGGGD